MPRLGNNPASTFRTLFSLDEIEASGELRAFFWILLGTFHMAYMDWRLTWSRMDPLGQSHACWAHFPWCEIFHFPNSATSVLPTALFFSFAFCLVATAAFAAWCHRQLLAHFCLVCLFFANLFLVYFASSRLSHNIHFFHLALSAIFLFASNKLFYLRRLLVLLYLLAALPKINGTWLLGTYFTSLSQGLPLIPRELTVVFTILGLLAEILSPPLLLSESRRFRLTALVFLLAFHSYSILIVGFRLPALLMPSLWILFGPKSRPEFASVTKTSIAPLFFCLFLIFLQSVPFLSVPRPLSIGLLEERFFLSRNGRYGVYVFDGNHQCVSKVESAPGSTPFPPQIIHSANAFNRCVPLEALQFIRRSYCKSPGHSVRWTFEHSVNGSPYYRVIDAVDPCTIDISAPPTQEWFRFPSEGASAVAEAAKNFLGPVQKESSDRFLNSQYYIASEHPRPPEMTRAQKALAPVSDFLVLTTMALWFCALLWQAFGWIRAIRRPAT